VRLAQELQEAGASALSVLTDEPFFGGSLQILRDVSAFTEVPRLRKDFILDPYQIYEAALHGADAVLLIVRLLDAAALRLCLETAHELGMDALVEVHADAELDRALEVGARIIGINHRDLDTLQMDMHLSERILARVPSGKILVAESGIHTAADVARMQALGVQALLIGEAIMLSSDVQQKVRALFSEVWEDRPLGGCA
jgi:indole-3-glycerol phosphate synthase